MGSNATNPKNEQDSTALSNSAFKSTYGVHLCRSSFPDGLYTQKHLLKIQHVESFAANSGETQIFPVNGMDGDIFSLCARHIELVEKKTFRNRFCDEC